MHEDAVRDIVFSPDGKQLATASADTTAGLWLWRSDDLIEAACTRLTQNFNEDEWRRYVGEERYRKTCPQLP
jgi:WD40 repeat protein